MRFEVIESDCTKMEVGRREEPYIKIVEQPASKALRFRYECEGRSAGSIPGVNSTPETKTYPTIQIVGYEGRAIVVVSCVTKKEPYQPHPHNLVGRDGCKRGICTVEVNNETMTQSFDHLGIQCVKKKDIEEALKAREEIRVDPFRTGFTHGNQPGSIDLNAVRLCFQAFLEDPPGKFKLSLIPVVSDIIYDKKALCDLAICKLSHSSAPVSGGMEMILLCEKVAKEDISVKFYEEHNGHVVWEGFGDFTPAQVHKQVAIMLKTPRYKTLQVENPVKVFIQLRRPSDGETSDALPFQMTPLDSGGVKDELSRKKPKVSHDIMLQEKDRLRVVTGAGTGVGAASPSALGLPLSPSLRVKREPADTSPNPYLVYGGVSPLQYHQTPPPPMEYNALSPNYQGQGLVYAPGCVNVAYTTGPVNVTTGRTAVSPSQPIYMSEMYLQGGNIADGLQNGTYLDISSSIQHPHGDMHTDEPMANISLNSKDFSELLNAGLDEGNLSENLSNNLSLNCDSNQTKKTVPSQENIDSFNSLVHKALSEFDE